MESSSSNAFAAMAFCILPITLLIVVFVITCNAAPPDEKPFVLGIPSNRTRPTEQPFECPEHENYHKCEKELCYKSCEHLIRPPACPSLDPDCFEPACLCEKDTLRNAQGQCVPVHQCRK